MTDELDVTLSAIDLSKGSLKAVKSPRCPFCRAESDDVSGPILRNRGYAHFVECTSCGAKGPAFKTQSKAIEIWGNCHPPKGYAIVKRADLLTLIDYAKYLVDGEEDHDGDHGAKVRGAIHSSEAALKEAK